MIEKPEQYYDAKRHQLYYQWRESEHYIHQEPIYDRTMDYIESLEAENAKLRGLVRDAHALATDHGVYVRYPYCDAWDEKLAVVEEQMRELGIEAER